LLTIDNLQLPISKTGIDNEAGEGGQTMLAVQLIAVSEPPSVTRYLEAAVSDATRRAYRADLKDFLKWGGYVPCTPGTLVRYIADRAAVHSVATIQRRVVGISRAHTSQGFPDPAKTDDVRMVIRGVRRIHGRPQRQAAPLMREDLVPLLNTMSGLKGMRDRALLILGFAAALRRSELVGLDVQHLSFVKEGMLVLLRRSKTDQEGEGRKIAVPYGRTSACPVKAVTAWLMASGIEDGPIFRSVSKAGRIAQERLSDQTVSLILKARVAELGLPQDAFSGHSLRAGLVTSAARAGVGLAKIQEQTGHRSYAMLAKYIRDANVFEDNAAGLLL
jgi:integrase